MLLGWSKSLDHFGPKSIARANTHMYKDLMETQDTEWLDQTKRLLAEEFMRLQAKNPAYSLRAFARRMKMSHSALSEVFAGKRKLTEKAAQKVLEQLQVDPKLIAKATGGSAYTSLDMDTYRLIADWYYFAILSLTETEDFVGKVDWIAQRIGLAPSAAESAVDLLLRLDLLEIDKKTKLIKGTGESFEAMSAIASAALKKAARQNIELASEALDTTEFEQRDFTAMTLTFDPDRMDEAKEMIKGFRRQFARKMESGKKKEVYKITIQLFPLSGRRQK